MTKTACVRGTDLDNREVDMLLQLKPGVSVPETDHSGLVALPGSPAILRIEGKLVLQLTGIENDT